MKYKVHNAVVRFSPAVAFLMAAHSLQMATPLAAQSDPRYTFPLVFLLTLFGIALIYAMTPTSLFGEYPLWEPEKEEPRIAMPIQAVANAIRAAEQAALDIDLHLPSDEEYSWTTERKPYVGVETTSFDRKTHQWKTTYVEPPKRPGRTP